MQGGPIPQVHSPLELHPSAAGPRPPIGGSVQSTHMEPIVPQLIAVRGRQTLPMQQPPGHDRGVHWHAPPTHCCPAWHTRRLPSVPQRHSPSVQRSATMPQFMHAAPPLPHCIAVGGLTHAVPEQHPAPHVRPEQDDVQIPAEQRPIAQTRHAAPPVPQALFWLPGRHVLPSQQPPHDCESQVQTPATQRWPGPHTLPPGPQEHAPLRQRSALVVLQAVHAAPAGAHALAVRVVQFEPAQQPSGHDVALHTHAPATQRCPTEQAALLPQRQAPFASQASARVVSHGAQAAPGAPQAPGASGVHVAPVQQPLGQEVASQTHSAALPEPTQR